MTGSTFSKAMIIGEFKIRRHRSTITSEEDNSNFLIFGWIIAASYKIVSAVRSCLLKPVSNLVVVRSNQTHDLCITVDGIKVLDSSFHQIEELRVESNSIAIYFRDKEEPALFSIAKNQLQQPEQWGKLTECFSSMAKM